MGVYQEDRMDAPRPEIEETEYGAKTVKVATETPIVDENVLSAESDAVTEAEGKSPAVEAEKPVKEEKKRIGRPKKAKK